MNKWLIIILVVAFFVRVYNLGYNTAFLDEAQYITEGMKILSGDIESGIGAVSWIGGSPFMFPMTTAFFYLIGGLMGSRMLMVLLGTLCVYLIYQFTKQLQIFRTERLNNRAGYIAAAFMSVTTIAVISSRLAIYDGLAFTFFLAGIIVFHKAIFNEERKFYILSSLLFFLSFLAKYIVVIFFPFILLVPVLLAFKKKNLKSLKGIGLNFGVPFILLTGLYIVTNFAALGEFITNQGVVSGTSFGEIFNLFWEYTGVSYILCLAGIALLWKKDKIVLGILLFLSLLPLIVHGMTGNDSSVQQHTFLTLVFILPVIGAIFTALIVKKRRIGILITVLALGLQVVFTLPQVQAAEQYWPNLNESAKLLNANLKPSDRILAESGDSLYLEIESKIAHDQLEGPFVFSYGVYEGQAAYVEAIKNGYFNYIQFDGIFFSEEDTLAIEEAMKKNYQKVFDDSKVRVYKLIN